jgi:hypothetical protein
MFFPAEKVTRQQGFRSNAIGKPLAPDAGATVLF